MKLVFFDHETTGLPLIQTPEVTIPENWPRAIQTAYRVWDTEAGVLTECCAILRPDGFEIPADTVKYHGISQERALAEGEDPREFFTRLLDDTRDATAWVAHNGLRFDMPILQAELKRLNLPAIDQPVVDTMLACVNLTCIPSTSPNAKPGTWRYPSLNALSDFLGVTGRLKPDRNLAHDALEDVDILQTCFEALLARDWLQLTPTSITCKDPFDLHKRTRYYSLLAFEGTLLTFPDPLDPVSLCTINPITQQSPLQLLIQRCAKYTDERNRLLNWLESAPLSINNPDQTSKIRRTLIQHFEMLSAARGSGISC